MFNEEKVSQMAAWFLQQRGGRMSYLKLMKLLYLSDRESMARFARSMSGDYMVSMRHGPVLSRTYEFISGTAEACPEQGWAYWIKDEANYEVSLKHGMCNRDDLDELSDMDIEILGKIFAKFGKMRRFEIRDYTHDHCPEWTDPKGSFLPIHPADIFKALGKSEDQVDTLVNYHETRTQLDKTLSALK